jgi:hypothetical protein
MSSKAADSDDEEVENLQFKIILLVTVLWAKRQLQ